MKKRISILVFTFIFLIASFNFLPLQEAFAEFYIGDIDNDGNPTATNRDKNYWNSSLSYDYNEEFNHDVKYTNAFDNRYNRNNSDRRTFHRTDFFLPTSNPEKIFPTKNTDFKISVSNGTNDITTEYNTDFSTNDQFIYLQRKNGDTTDKVYSTFSIANVSGLDLAQYDKIEIEMGYCDCYQDAIEKGTYKPQINIDLFRSNNFNSMNSSTKIGESIGYNNPKGDTNKLAEQFKNFDTGMQYNEDGTIKTPCANQYPFQDGTCYQRLNQYYGTNYKISDLDLTTSQKSHIYTYVSLTADISSYVENVKGLQVTLQNIGGLQYGVLWLGSVRFVKNASHANYYVDTGTDILENNNKTVYFDPNDSNALYNSSKIDSGNFKITSGGNHTTLYDITTGGIGRDGTNCLKVTFNKNNYNETNLTDCQIHLKSPKNTFSLKDSTVMRFYVQYKKLSDNTDGIELKPMVHFENWKGGIFDSGDGTVKAESSYRLTPLVYDVYTGKAEEYHTCWMLYSIDLTGVDISVNDIIIRFNETKHNEGAQILIDDIAFYKTTNTLYPAGEYRMLNNCESLDGTTVDPDYGSELSMAMRTEDYISSPLYDDSVGGWLEYSDSTAHYVTLNENTTGTSIKPIKVSGEDGMLAPEYGAVTSEMYGHWWRSRSANTDLGNNAAGVYKQTFGTAIDFSQYTHFYFDMNLRNVDKSTLSGSDNWAIPGLKGGDHWFRITFCPNANGLQNTISVDFKLKQAKSGVNNQLDFIDGDANVEVKGYPLEGFMPGIEDVCTPYGTMRICVSMQDLVDYAKRQSRSVSSIRAIRLTWYNGNPSVATGSPYHSIDSKSDSKYRTVDIILDNFMAYKATKMNLRIEHGDTVYADGKATTPVLDGQQGFFYQIKGSSFDSNTKNVDMTVTIPYNKKSVTIIGLPYGTYSVTPLPNAAWRYESETPTRNNELINKFNSSMALYTLQQQTAIVTFSYERNKEKWLNHNAYRRQIW